MTPHGRGVAAALLLATAGMALAEDVVRVRLVAQPDDPASGLEPGETVTPAPDPERLSIDTSGGVLFTGAVHDDSGTLVHIGAILDARNEALRAVVVPGDPAPTEGGVLEDGWTVYDVTDARRSLLGNLVVEARIQKAPLLVLAYLTDIDGVARTAAAELHQAPGVCYFEHLGADSEAYGGSFALHGKTLAFQGRHDDQLCPGSRHGVYQRIEGLTPTVVAAEDTAVPGLPGVTWGGLFGGSRISEDADMVFGAGLNAGAEWYTAVIFRDDLTQDHEVIARTDVPVHGTAATVVQLTQWRIAPRVEELATWVRRVGYIAIGSVSGKFGDPDNTKYVFDTAAGPDPIMWEGYRIGDHEFAGTLASPASIELAEDRRLILVGEATGPDMPGGQGSAVWRCVHVASPWRELVLYEGMTLPTAAGSGGTVDAIATVNVNHHGRIAAEVVLDGAQAIVMEERDPGVETSFRVVVRKGDALPARDGTVEVVSVFGATPTYPRVSGSGFGGRQSRFNEQGEFVFAARAVFPGGGIRSGVYAVSLESPP
jgi:hypothetical protein